jgi:hypothetical protein
METGLRILDVVALTQDIPQQGLRRGQVGTIVEAPASDVFEVEFSDDEGRAYALLAIPAGQLMRLHHAPIKMV